MTLLLRLPPGFPDATPDMFWVDPPLHTAEGATIPGTESIEQHAGRSWQRWSRHIQGQWRPGIDNLATYMFYVRRCLLQGRRPAMSEQAITLAMTEALWDELTRALDDKCEVAGVLSAQLVDHGDGEVTLLGRNLTSAPADTYADRFADGLALTSPGWVPAARTALAENSAVVFIHTHPHGHAVFSSRDDTVDAGLLRAVTGMAERANYAALVIAGTSKDPAVAARLYGRLTVTHGEPDSDPGSREPAMVDRFRIVGDRVRVLTRGPQSFADDIFDRQVLAFGRQGQATLADLHVGVVGAGGTGSAVAEQLSRLGVGRLTLIDDDVVTAATPTRGYGMSTRDTGRAKATVLAEHIEQIGFGKKSRPSSARYRTSRLGARLPARTSYSVASTATAPG